MKRASKLPHWPPRLPRLTGGFRWDILPRIAVALVVAAMLTAILFTQLDYFVVGSRLEQFRPGQPAPQNITAPSTIRWEDSAETERRRDEAAHQVGPVYAYDPKALTAAHEELNQLFAQLRQSATVTEHSAGDPDDLSPEVARAAHRLDKETLTAIHEQALEILDQVMQSRIEQGNDEEETATRVTELARARVQDPDALLVLTAITHASVHPTWIRDEIRTAERERTARDAVRPQVRTFKQGEVIIRKGDDITERDLTQLRASRLLSPAPLARVIPLAAIMLFAITSLGVYLRYFVPAVYQNNRKLLLLAFLILTGVWAAVTLGGGSAATIGKNNNYLIALIAIPSVSMAIAGLLGIPSAIVSTIVLSVTAGLAADNQFAHILLTMGSAFTGIMVVSSIWPANRAIPAVLSLIGVNLVLLVSVTFLLPGQEIPSVWRDLGFIALQAGAGGLGATFVAVGAIYILARPFGITTHYRLMELSNPNEPLLRKMMIEAPGSYHSSVMVANIAEAAADAIGANALLTRVAALYHDVGKLRRPGFFVENQAPLGIENMHQRLSPKLSYLILTSHVKEGVEVAREYKLPEEVISVIREHHGTTLAAYFYHRALSEAGEEGVAEHEFRYPGPKPSTRESAVVMLSDSVQASVKALKEPTPGRIENMVHEIINNRLNDGQLEDCDITLRDLRRLGEIFVRILTGLYTYTRIEYPDIKKGEGTRSRVNTHSETTPPSGEPTAATPGS